MLLQTVSSALFFRQPVQSDAGTPYDEVMLLNEMKKLPERLKFLSGICFIIVIYFYFNVNAVIINYSFAAMLP